VCGPLVACEFKAGDFIEVENSLDQNYLVPKTKALGLKDI